MMIFGNKRSEVEIIHKLLSLSEQDIKKTNLMYKTNLCYPLFNKYLNFLLENDFLNKRSNDGNGQTFFITKKGKNVLDKTTSLLEEFS